MATRAINRDESFARNWQAEILEKPPLIAPARQYVYPQAVDEVELGALQILLRPGSNPATSGQGATPIMMTFALGFADLSLPHGIWSCPNPNQICAIAGGYAYIVQADEPETWVQVSYRPVVSVHPVPEQHLLVFTGFYQLWALGPEGRAWETARLSWEGLRVTKIADKKLQGFGWDIHTDAEVAFTVDLATGSHTGGAGRK